MWLTVEKELKIKDYPLNSGLSNTRIYNQNNLIYWYAQGVKYLAPQIAGKLVVAGQDKYMNNISTENKQNKKSFQRNQFTQEPIIGSWFTLRQEC